MRVVTQGPLISLYVNGHLLDQVDDDSLADGGVGLWVQKLQEIAFDNLIVIEEGLKPHDLRHSAAKLRRSTGASL